MLNASSEIIKPAENTVDNGSVSDEFPIILLHDAVSAKSIDDHRSCRNRVNQLQMKSSAPVLLLLVHSVDILLLFSENKPEESDTYHVAHDGHGVKQMVSGLQENSFLWGEEGVFTEMDSVIRGLDAGPQGHGR